MPTSGAGLACPGTAPDAAVADWASADGAADVSDVIPVCEKSGGVGHGASTPALPSFSAAAPEAAFAPPATCGGVRDGAAAGGSPAGGGGCSLVLRVMVEN